MVSFLAHFADIGTMQLSSATLDHMTSHHVAFGAGKRAIARKTRTATVVTAAAPSVGFRPCIDIHDGRVKQIVGSTLSDVAGGPAAGQLETNFDSNLGTVHCCRLAASLPRRLAASRTCSQRDNSPSHHPNGLDSTGTFPSPALTDPLVSTACRWRALRHYVQRI